MGVDRSIARRAGQVLALPIGDMFPIPLNVPLGQSKINQKYFIRCLVMPNTKVIGFDVPMDKIPIMHVLNPSNHLINQH